ncbi:hypothetical protein [Kutzneria sp. NPDC052558]|uniref:hypothetical protein n=1 Tax=Kutzneria sp. NPDC052558 TaxID=3364121 RepID=UPI0037C907CD
MTESIEIGEVDRNHGAVVGNNSGTVNTIGKITADTIFLLQLAGQQAAKRAGARHWFTQRHLSEMSALFVEPVGFTQAQAVLLDRKSVLLAGRPGTGRSTAAAVLLHRVGGANQIGLVDVNLSGDHEPTLDVEQVRGNESLLLDLSGLDMSSFLRVARELGSLMARVTEADSLLVVVLPDYERQLPGAIEHRPRVELSLTPELAQRIFERNLGQDDIVPGPPSPALMTMFNATNAGELTELAELVANVMAEPAPWSEALPRALDELKEQLHELTELFEKHPEATWRSLLVSVALLDGGPADAVFEADRALLNLLAFPEPEDHPLARPGLTARLSEVDAKLAAGRVRFARHHHSEAVLWHTWREFPGLRSTLTRWIERVPKLARTVMTDDDRATVAARFTSVAIRHGSVPEVLFTVKQWSSGSARISALAVQALGEAVLDSQHGWRFRRQVYTWARDPKVPPRLAAVLISVCENVLGLAYPVPAMIRLHHLTAHQDDTVGAAAVEALLRMATGTRERKWLLGRVVARLRDNAPGRDAAVFGRLIDLAEPQDPDLLLTAWRGALGRPDSVTALRTWLSTSDDSLLELLVQACDRRTSALGWLRAVTAAWIAEDRPEREHVGRLLDVKIESVLGLARTAPGGRG